MCTRHIIDICILMGYKEYTETWNDVTSDDTMKDVTNSNTWIDVSSTGVVVNIDVPYEAGRYYLNMNGYELCDATKELIFEWRADFDGIEFEGDVYQYNKFVVQFNDDDYKMIKDMRSINEVIFLSQR